MFETVFGLLKIIIQKKNFLLMICSAFICYFFVKSIIFEHHYQILFESSVLCETSLPSENEKSDLYKFCEMHERNTRKIEEEIANIKVVKPRNYIFEFLLFTTVAVLIGLDKFYCVEEEFP